MCYAEIRGIRMSKTHINVFFCRTCCGEFDYLFKDSTGKYVYFYYTEVGLA